MAKKTIDFNKNVYSFFVGLFGSVHYKKFCPFFPHGCDYECNYCLNQLLLWLLLNWSYI
jgi:hypothetical protein